MDCPYLSSAFQSWDSHMVDVIKSSITRECSVDVFHFISCSNHYKVLHLNHTVNHCQKRRDYLIQGLSSFTTASCTPIWTEDIDLVYHDNIEWAFIPICVPVCLSINKQFSDLFSSFTHVLGENFWPSQNLNVRI